MSRSISLATCVMTLSLMVPPVLPQGASITVGDEVVFSGGPSQPPRSIQTGFTLEASNIRGSFGDGPGVRRKLKSDAGRGGDATTAAGTDGSDGAGNRPAWMPRGNPTVPAVPDLTALSADDLNAALGDQDAARRRGAIAALASRTAPADRSLVRSALESALADREPRVVQEAAEALGKLGDAASAPAVMRLVYDRDDGVAVSAINSVRVLGYRQAIPELAKLGARDTGPVGSAAKLAARVLARPAAAPKVAAPVAAGAAQGAVPLPAATPPAAPPPPETSFE